MAAQNSRVLIPAEGDSMRRAVALLSTLTLATVLLALAGSSASASGAAVQSLPDGCRTDTIASKVINGLTYTATERTCVETLAGQFGPDVRAHGVTRCYRSGSPWNCLSINGDSVHTHLWRDGFLFAYTAPGDADCSNCQENSHYSESVSCSGASYRYVAKEENLRVAWVAGQVSDLHTHTSDPADFHC